MASPNQPTGQNSGALKEDARAVLDILKAKLEALQAREHELHNNLKALGLEWVLRVPKSSSDTSSTPATAEEGAEGFLHCLAGREAEEGLHYPGDAGGEAGRFPLYRFRRGSGG